MHTLTRRDLIDACPNAGWNETYQATTAPIPEVQQRYRALGIEADYAEKTLACKICGELPFEHVGGDPYAFEVYCDPDKHAAYYARFPKGEI